MSTRHPSQIINPSSLPFLNSKDTRKTCFSCHFMCNFLHFYYKKISLGDKFLLHSSSSYLLVPAEFLYVHHPFFDNGHKTFQCFSISNTGFYLCIMNSKSIKISYLLNTVNISLKCSFSLKESYFYSWLKLNIISACHLSYIYYNLTVTNLNPQ